MLPSLLALALSLAAQPVSPRDRIVVVVSLDGFPAYSLEDPKLPVPTLRRLAREGASARRMTVSNPAVTWPNHTTLVTGVHAARHGVLFNGLLMGSGVARRIEPWRDKAEMVAVPTIYDLAFKAGLTTAQVDWVPTQNAGTINWEFPEVPSTKGAVEREMIVAGILSSSDIEEFDKGSTALRDHYWTAAAVHIITKHKPNLLMLHLLNQDSTHHTYGSRGRAAATAFALADLRVRQVLDAITLAGLQDRATLVIVSDHGFKDVRKNLRPNALLRREQLSDASRVVSEGGTAMVYLAEPALAARVKGLLGRLEGVERILEPPDYAALGLPHPRENRQMADLALVAKDGYAFTNASDGEPVVAVPPGATPASHGYLASDPDMDAIFLAWGFGIRTGVRLDRVANVDVAPTVAALLGLPMPDVAGRVLPVLR